MIQSNNIPISANLKFFSKFINNDPSAEVIQSLDQLIIFLYNSFVKGVIVIIDEYDAPVSNMFWSNHYENIKLLHGKILETLKNNPFVKQAILIGCFPVPLDEGSSELNDLKEITILNKRFAKYFGFTQEDVDELLEKICRQGEINGQEQKNIKDAVKNWYNGYLIYDTTIYNPYSIMNFIRYYMETLNLKQSLQCYWANNSKRKLIKQCFKRLNRI